MRIIGWITCIIIGLVLFGAFLTTLDPLRPSGHAYTATSAPYAPPPDLTRGAHILRQDPWIDSAVHLAGVKVVIGASKTQGVKDIVLECDFAGGSRTVISRTVRTIYETVPAGAKRAFDVKLGFYPQGTRYIGCSVVRAMVSYVTKADMDKAQAEAIVAQAKAKAKADAEEARRQKAYRECTAGTWGVDAVFKCAEKHLLKR